MIKENVKSLQESPLLKGGGIDSVDDGGLPEQHFLPRNKELKPPSRELRTNSTKQENHLWYDFLRDFTPRFTRQRIVNNYILDFYCHEIKLAIEVDGSHHYEEDSIEYDNARTEYLNGLGIEVVRFTNKDINKRFAGVCEKIKATVEERG